MVAYLKNNLDLMPLQPCSDTTCSIVNGNQRGVNNCNDLTSKFNRTPVHRSSYNLLGSLLEHLHRISSRTSPKTSSRSFYREPHVHSLSKTIQRQCRTDLSFISQFCFVSTKHSSSTPQSLPPEDLSSSHKTHVTSLCESLWKSYAQGLSKASDKPPLTDVPKSRGVST